jgi:glutamine amidotransferase
MTLAIVQYNAGNIQSVIHALRRLGVEPVLSDDAEVLAAADKVIFPGVGEASSAMRYLQAKGLDHTLRQLRQPTLGICLGLQLMCRHSEENNSPCLGIFDLEVKRFESSSLKVPHIGWNTIQQLSSPLFKGIAEESYVYYVHSYYATLGQHSIAQSHYAQAYSAAIHRDNFYAVQFHPEKSSQVGAQILQNFLSL